MTKNDDFMGRAVELSRESKGGPFGAVVVKDGKIIGEGSNSVIVNNDPTGHAEVMAIRDACKNLKTHKLDDSVLITSCEPCPLCLSAVYWSGIKKVIYANTRHDAEDIGFSDKFIYEELMKSNEEKSIDIERIYDVRAKRVFYNWNGQLY